MTPTKMTNVDATGEKTVIVSGGTKRNVLKM